MIQSYKRPPSPADLLGAFYGFLEIPDRREAARVKGTFSPQEGIGSFEYMLPVGNRARLEKNSYKAATLYVGDRPQRVHNVRLRKSEPLPGNLQRRIYTFNLSPNNGG